MYWKVGILYTFCLACGVSLYIASSLRWSNVDLNENTKLNALEKSNYMDIWNQFTDAKNIWMRIVADLKKNGKHWALESANRQSILLRRDLIKAMEKSNMERRSQLKKLSEFIYKKLYQLQNPRNCSNAKLLVCGIGIKCGFGCYVHTILNCLLKAFDLERVLIFRPNNCQYDRDCMERIFLPTTKCAYKDVPLNKIPFLNGLNGDTRVVQIPQNHTPCLAWKIPAILADPLLGIHGDPYVWWLGQLVTYVLRPQPLFQKKIYTRKEEIGFRSPIACIQVRRGDKLRRIAKYYSVEEYMTYVDLWFDQLELDQPGIQRRLFIATEDHTVFGELKKKYPKYTLVFNEYVNTTVTKHGRYSTGGLESITLDVFFLSMCDYLVCTFSSNVCRLSYELMMNLRADASTRVQSLDIPYKFKLIWARNWTAVMSHEPLKKTGELELQIGDKISVMLEGHRQYNKGFHPGKNLRTQKSGIFPTNKARPDVLLHSFSLLKQKP